MSATFAELLAEGWRRHQQGHLAAAVDCYQSVLASQPNHADAWCYMGIAFYDLGRMADSVTAYRRAIKTRPEFPIAWSNLGNSLSALERYDEAIESCRQAIAQQPTYATAHMNLGAALVKCGRFAEAEQALRRALELAPANDAAHRNLGAALVRQGQYEAGVASARQALHINPRNAEAHTNLALVRMLHGDWLGGFEEFEWRWQTPDLKPTPHAKPLWTGEPLAGKTVLLHAEQGLGDTLQFARYAPLVKARGGRVALQCQSVLKPLLANCRGVDVLLGRDEMPPPFDCHLPLMSLPRIFEHTPDNAPAETPYLWAEPARVEAWRRRVGQAGFRIGVAWQGSRQHQADLKRSMPLQAFRPLAELAGVRLISLQKGDGEEQLSASGFPIESFGDELDRDAPFLDTAALISCLDLIVTVDTSIAHLAGALDAPTWIALGYSPDWRWLLNRTDSVWYPRLRLFRQARLGEWPDVLGRIAAAVAAIIASRSSPAAVDPLR